MSRKIMFGVFVSVFASATASALTVATPSSDVSPAATTATVVLNTSPLYANANQSYHNCNIVNVTTKTSLTLNVQIFDYKGSVIASYGNLVLAPGMLTGIANFAYTGFARCQITFKGAASYVRANLSVFHSTGSYTETIAFSEAR